MTREDTVARGQWFTVRPERVQGPNAVAGCVGRMPGGPAICSAEPISVEDPSMLPSNRRLQAVAVAVALVFFAACGKSGSPAAGGPTTTASKATSTAPHGPADVKIGTTKFGPTLVDATGRTLYEWDSDPDGQSTCQEECAMIWPPLAIKGNTIVVGPGLVQSEFKTIFLPHGGTGVVMNGRALYNYVYDVKPGQVGGQPFGGGVWHAVHPNGQLIG